MLLILSPATEILQAQNSPHHEIWGTYTSRRYLQNKKLWLRCDYGARSAFTEEPSTTFLARLRLIFSVGNDLELIPAIDFRYSHYAELPNIMEIRTWEGAQLNWPYIGRVSFDHFYRFEQRFYITEGNTKDHISLRSRYRLRMRIPFNNKAVGEKTYFTDLSLEAFLPHDDSINELFANTIRLGVTAGYNHSVKWRYYLIGYVDRGRNNFDNNVTNDRYIISFKARRSLFQEK